jgi:hypothetical protein
VVCEECEIELGADSDLRLELTDDDQAVVHRAECWEREFGET